MSERKIYSSEEESIYWNDKDNTQNIPLKKTIGNAYFPSILASIISILLVLIIILILCYGIFWVLSAIKSLWITLYVMEIL